MRIIEVLHSFSTAGALTILSLVDDLVNSISQGPTELYSAIIKAVSPDFQDRTLGSLKSKDINIELEVLEKDYPFLVREYISNLEVNRSIHLSHILHFS